MTGPLNVTTGLYISTSPMNALENIISESLSNGSETQTTVAIATHETTDWLAMRNGIITYVLPWVMIVGLIGNILLMYIMFKPDFRRLPIRVYFTALAVSDTALLIFDNAGQWFDMANVQLSSRSEVVCRLCYYLLHSSLTLSMSLTLAVAVQRALVVSMPLKARLFSKYRHAVITVTSIAAFTAVYNIPYLVVYGLQVSDQGVSCKGLIRYTDFIRIYKARVTPFLYHYIPNAGLVICNIIIIRILVDARRKRAALTGNHAEVDNVRRFTVSAVVMISVRLLTSTPNIIYYVIIVQNDMQRNKTPFLLFIECILSLIGAIPFAFGLFIYAFTSKQLQHHLRLITCKPCDVYRNRSTEETKIGNKALTLQV